MNTYHLLNKVNRKWVQSPPPQQQQHQPANTNIITNSIDYVLQKQQQNQHQQRTFYFLSARPLGVAARLTKINTFH